MQTLHEDKPRHMHVWKTNIIIINILFGDHDGNDTCDVNEIYDYHDESVLLSW